MALPIGSEYPHEIPVNVYAVQMASVMAQDYPQSKLCRLSAVSTTEDLMAVKVFIRPPTVVADGLILLQ
jgi:hypothetical protein